MACDMNDNLLTTPYDLAYQSMHQYAQNLLPYTLNLELRMLEFNYSKTYPNDPVYMARHDCLCDLIVRFEPINSLNY